jgi:hypothetical protein
VTGKGNENRKPTHGVCEILKLKMRGGSGKKEEKVGGKRRGERREGAPRVEGVCLFGLF